MRKETPNFNDRSFNRLWSDSGCLEAFDVFKHICDINPNISPSGLIEKYSPKLRDMINASARNLERTADKRFRDLSLAAAA
jgi:hypothetical protein